MFHVEHYYYCYYFSYCGPDTRRGVETVGIAYGQRKKLLKKKMGERYTLDNSLWTFGSGRALMVAMIDRWRRRGSTHNSLRVFFAVLAVAGAVWGAGVAWGEFSGTFYPFALEDTTRKNLRVFVDVGSFLREFSASQSQFYPVMAPAGEQEISEAITPEFLMASVAYALSRWEHTGINRSVTFMGE